MHLSLTHEKLQRSGWTLPLVLRGNMLEGDVFLPSTLLEGASHSDDWTAKHLSGRGHAGDLEKLLETCHHLGHWSIMELNCKVPSS